MIEIDKNFILKNFPEDNIKIIHYINSYENCFFINKEERINKYKLFITELNDITQEISFALGDVNDDTIHIKRYREYHRTYQIFIENVLIRHFNNYEITLHNLKLKYKLDLL